MIEGRLNESKRLSDRAEKVGEGKSPAEPTIAGRGTLSQLSSVYIVRNDQTARSLWLLSSLQAQHGPQGSRYAPRQRLPARIASANTLMGF